MLIRSMNMPVASVHDGLLITWRHSRRLVSVRLWSMRPLESIKPRGAADFGDALEPENLCDPWKRRSGCAAGDLLVSGVQLGNVWVGVQPALGVEGDPMRLLFERDLTPHPQYAAFYNWLQHDFQADAVLHFGMHGTVEWLPGAPLGRNRRSPSSTTPARLLTMLTA